MDGLGYLLCVIALGEFTVGYNYCGNDALCEVNKTHTMCAYKSPKPSSRCGIVGKVGLTSDEITSIVQVHNALRDRVASGREIRGNPGPQPPAERMNKLRWDPELAKIAQRWANQCKFDHDECRGVERFAVGQNIAAASTNGVNNFTVQDMITSWYDEVVDFDSSYVTQVKNYSEVGHYTQLVWADTTNVGCGHVHYYKDNWNHKYLVCNYGPAGNYENGELYKIKRRKESRKERKGHRAISN